MAAERIEASDISAPEASKLSKFQRFKRTLLSALELPDGYGRRGRVDTQTASTSVKKKGDGPQRQPKPNDGTSGSNGKTEDDGDGKDGKDGKKKKGLLGKFLSSS